MLLSSTRLLFLLSSPSLSGHSRWTLQLSHLAASGLETNQKKSSLHLDQQLFAKRCKALFITDCLARRTMERCFGFLNEENHMFWYFPQSPKQSTKFQEVPVKQKRSKQQQSFGTTFSLRRCAHTWKSVCHAPGAKSSAWDRRRSLSTQGFSFRAEIQMEHFSVLQRMTVCHLYRKDNYSNVIQLLFCFVSIHIQINDFPFELV